MKRNIFMRFPGGCAKAFTLSYDDGVEQDAQFIEMIDRYGLKATFNLNSGEWVPEGTVFEPGRIHRRLTKSAAAELYNKNGHEVATHAYTHPFLERLSPASVCYEIIKDREALEEQFGTIVRGHAYPYGTYSDTVVNCLRDCGIVYARTTRATHAFEIPKDWLRLDPTCHHDDPRALELAKSFVEMSPNTPKLYYLWGHTYEFEDKNNWEHMEDICRVISGHDDIWYANNIDIYNYIKAYESLLYSADSSMIHNPTASTVYISVNGKTYSIAPGEALKPA